MRSIQLQGEVNEQGQLVVQLPAGVPAGPMRVTVVVPEDASWAQAAVQAWAAEWNDPAEDIYSFTDGAPVR